MSLSDPSPLPEGVNQTLRDAAVSLYDQVGESPPLIQSEEDLWDIQDTTLSEMFDNDGEFSLVGRGHGRLVVTHPTIGDSVIKIAMETPEEITTYPIDGVSQNRREAWLWSHMPDELEHRFTPVENVWFDFRLLQMPRVQTHPSSLSEDKVRSFIRETKYLLFDREWGAIRLTDEVIGKRNSHYEIYDYGIPIGPVDSLGPKSELPHARS